MDATCKEEGQVGRRSPLWQRLIASWLLVTGEQIVEGGNPFRLQISSTTHWGMRKLTQRL